MSIGDRVAERLPGNFGKWYRKRRTKKKNAKPPETAFQHLVAWLKTLVWALCVVTIVNGIAIASFTVPTGSMEDTVLPGDFLFVNKFSYGPSTPQIIPFLNQPLPYWKLPAPFPPKQGDVIVFVFPGNREQIEPDHFEYYLKRCVAVAGDTLEIRNKRVFVNGVEFGLPQLAKFTHKGYTAEMWKNVVESNRIGTFPEGRNFSQENYGPIRIPREGDVININPSNFYEWAVFIGREGHEVDMQNMTVDGHHISAYTVERNYVFGMGDNRDNSADSRFWGFIPEKNVVGIPMFIYWSWENPASNIGGYNEETELSNAQRNGTNLDQRKGAESMSGFESLGYRLKHVRWSRLGTIIR